MQTTKLFLKDSEASFIFLLQFYLLKFSATLRCPLCAVRNGEMARNTESKTTVSGLNTLNEVQNPDILDWNPESMCRYLKSTREDPKSTNQTLEVMRWNRESNSVLDSFT